MKRVDGWLPAAATALLLALAATACAGGAAQPPSDSVVAAPTEAASVEPSSSATSTPATSSAPAPAAEPTSEDAAAVVATPEPKAVEDPGATDPEGGGAEVVSAHPIAGQGCVLWLHGAGTPPPGRVEDWDEGMRFVAPHSGASDFPWFWLYDGPYLDYATDDGPYDALVSGLRAELDRNDCGPVLMVGGSNGAAFVAKMYCRGEDFGGRLWGVVVDDPVPDAGVIGCAPSSAVQRSLFTHSAEIASEVESFVDNRCTSTTSEYGAWYCEDDIAFSVEDYEAHIGQASYLGREEHVGANSDDLNWWVFHLRWWHEYDPDTYAHLAGR